MSCAIEFKKIFTRPKLKVIINNKEYNVVGRLGMYHSIIDVTECNEIKNGDLVTINVAPIYINSNIRREYV